MSRHDELIAQNWTRRFMTGEPRLSEAVRNYQALGFEVHLEAVGSAAKEDGECTECFAGEPDRYKVIYTRPLAGAKADPDGLWEDG